MLVCIWLFLTFSADIFFTAEAESVISALSYMLLEAYWAWTQAFQSNQKRMFKIYSRQCFGNVARIWGMSTKNAVSARMGMRENLPVKTLFSTCSLLRHGHISTPKHGEELHVTFILKDGSQKTYEVSKGETLLDIAQAHNLDMEGACGGSCACSTCHVIVDPEYYDALPEPDDDENDMLDLAYGLTETSRLGCQIKMSKDIDGIRVALPALTRNVNMNDFKD